jgi:putative membrane protein
MRFRAKQNKVRDAIFLVLKGIAMGAANKVPGVSGGIVALVGGFYEKLIFSFQRLNGKALMLLVNGRFKSFWDYVNGSFLSLLFSGVIISYFSISLLLDYLLERYETVVLGGFFGMILASLCLIFKQVNHWNKSTLTTLFIGFSLGLTLTFVRPATENDHLFFVFFLWYHQCIWNDHSWTFRILFTSDFRKLQSTSSRCCKCPFSNIF